MILSEFERIDDLEINGLRLIQDSRKYCFTSDSVLLANTAVVRPKMRALDLCAGTGIISILLAGKKNVQNVVAVEIQHDLAKLAERNVKLNNLDDKITVLNISVQNAVGELGVGEFDAVVTNPPYMKVGAGEMDADPCLALCKYELALTLDELLLVAARLLKFGGRFYMIHRADRLAETVYKLKKEGLEPKTLTLVYPKANKAPDTVIYDCVKGGREGVSIKSLIVFDENDRYTAEAARLYSKD